MSIVQIGDPKIITKILAEDVPFQSEDDEKACWQLIGELSFEELETAAKTSHTYWLTTIREDLIIDDDDDDDDDELTIITKRQKVKEKFAAKEARRHYVGEGRNYNKALMALREAISYRNQYKIDLIRFISEVDNLDHIMILSDEEKETVKRYRAMVDEELGKQLTISGGVDKENSVFVVRFSRNKPETNEEAFMITQLYITERALAGTEYYTHGKGEQVVALFDYGDYVSANSPPILTLKAVVQKMQRMYPERLKKMILTDAPFWMRALYNVFYHLLPEKTKDKIALTVGATEKEKQLTALINVESLLPLVDLSDWKISSTVVNTEHYLNQSMFETFIPICKE